MNDADDVPTALSALQHWVYCLRQCGLTYLKQAFEDDIHTAREQIVVFRSGVDWNSLIITIISIALVCRPAFGSGVDWNRRYNALDTTPTACRPAFGSGVDWNHRKLMALFQHALCRPAFRSGVDWNDSIAEYERYLVRVARPTSRAWIETEWPNDDAVCSLYVARPSGRVDWNEARYGTQRELLACRPTFGPAVDWNFEGIVKPIHGAQFRPPSVGRGLKQSGRDEARVPDRCRPTFGSGVDWNDVDLTAGGENSAVSSGLRVGRGLKHLHRQL